MKLVINKCYGGFGLSREATLRLAEKKGISPLYFEKEFGLHHYYTVPVEQFKQMRQEDRAAGNFARSNAVYYYPNYDRSDLDLIAVVEELGEAANGQCAQLKIIEIPAGIDYEIEEYDGLEWVAERHRRWS